MRSASSGSVLWERKKIRWMCRRRTPAFQRTCFPFLAALRRKRRPRRQKRRKKRRHRKAGWHISPRGRKQRWRRGSLCLFMRFAKSWKWIPLRCSALPAAFWPPPRRIMPGYIRSSMKTAAYPPLPSNLRRSCISVVPLPLPGPMATCLPAWNS